MSASFKDSVKGLILRSHPKRGGSTKRKSERKSGKQIQDEQQRLLKNFSQQEITKIEQLVKDLHKIRKVDARSVSEIEEQIDMILEQQHYYIGDSIISFGWQNDKEKIYALWQYLQQEFGKKTK